MNRTSTSLALLALVTLLALAPAVAFAQVGNIDPAEKNAWAENAGWIHFRNAGAFPYGVATTSLPVALQGFKAE